MIRRLTVLALLCALAMPASAGGARAAELLMFEDLTCRWCVRWHAEIGPSYPNSPEGQLAPLRRVHIADQSSSGVVLTSPVRATPTFVLVDNGQEVGRIVGYAGADFFYPQVGELLRRLPPPPARDRLPPLKSAANTR